MDDIHIWHVYFSPMCRHTKPRPKDKLVIAVCVEAEAIMGFLINSKVSNYIKNRPYLNVCQAGIGGEEPGLQYDSIVDCHSLYRFTASDFAGDRGEISNNGKKQILEAVRDCPTIVKRYKKLILDNGSGLI